MADQSQKIKVAFCCLGNICRSPMAEAVFRHVTHQQGVQDRFVIDSFGTGAYHLGESPDRRSMQECKKNGVNVGSHRAQQITKRDLEKFDYIMAMDDMNYDDLKQLAGAKQLQDKVHLFGEYRKDLQFADQVADPYYGGKDGFAVNYKQLEHFAQCFLEQIS